MYPYILVYLIVNINGEVTSLIFQKMMNHFVNYYVLNIDILLNICFPGIRFCTMSQISDLGISVFILCQQNRKHFVIF